MIRSFATSRRTVVIREANVADAAGFRELRLEALQNSPIAFSADYQKNISHPAKYWEDLLSPHPDESTMFIAEVDGKLIAMTGVMRGSSPKTRHSAWIWGVYVTPAWRGLHIAEEIIRSCIEWAGARNVVLAKLGVAAVNQPAIRCYERCGFKIYGTEPRAVFVDGKYYDEYLMFKSLDGL
ncbi:MAG: N-acetyltransferase family protein [Bacteroidota bacterium]